MRSSYTRFSTSGYLNRRAVPKRHIETETPRDRDWAIHENDGRECLPVERDAVAFKHSTNKQKKKGKDAKTSAQNKKNLVGRETYTRKHENEEKCKNENVKDKTTQHVIDEVPPSAASSITLQRHNRSWKKRHKSKNGNKDGKRKKRRKECHPLSRNQETHTHAQDRRAGVYAHIHSYRKPGVCESKK